MRMSVCVMADVDEIGFYPHIESLGYDSAWVADSQMLFSDCYAVLALAARQTTRLRLGPGRGHLRHPHPAGARGGHGHAQPARAGPGAPRHRHRQHRDAQHGPAADAHRGLRRVPARAARPAPGRRGGLRLRGHAPPDQDADPREEVHEPRAAHPALRLRVRAARHGAGRPVRRRPGLRDPAARPGPGRGPRAGRRRGPARRPRRSARTSTCAR